MPRVHVLDRIDDGRGVPLSGATVTVRTVGTGTTLPQTLYAGGTGGTTVANPITTAAGGMVDYWLDTPVAVDHYVEGPGMVPQTRTVEPALATDRVMDLDTTQTVTGAKTFTGATTFSGVTFSDIQAAIANGSAANPSLRLQNSPTTGLYRAGAHQLGIAANGAARAVLGPDHARFYQGTTSAIVVDAGESSTPITPPAAFGGSERVSPINATLHGAMSSSVEVAPIWGYGLAYSGSDGYMIGVKGTAVAPAAGSWAPSGENGVIGILGIGQSSKNSGMARGGNFIAEVLAGTSGKSIGVELDVMSQVALSERIGLIVAAVRSPDTAHAHASSEARDYGIWFGNKAKSSQFPKGWLAGIMFGRPSVGAIPGATEGIMFPVDATGALIKADSRNLNGAGTATYGCAVGIDFENLVTTSFQILLKGVAFNPSGDLDFLTTGRRIFVNGYDGSPANRTLVQSRTGNNATFFGAAPIGSSTFSGLEVFNNSTPTAAGSAGMYLLSAAASLDTGSGVTSWVHKINGATLLTLASGKVTQAGAHVLTGVVTPPQITSNQDNYNPTSLASARVLAIESDAARNITGIVAQTAGTILTILNKGSFTITLKHNTTSSAGNLFFFTGGTDVAIASAGAVTLFYTAGAWFRIG